MRTHRIALLSAGVMLAAALAAPAQDRGCAPALTLDALKRMSGDELLVLYRASDVGRPLDGNLKGRLVHIAGRGLPTLKFRLGGALWRGKTAQASDGYFINRWVGGVSALDSRYVIGPSWIDGRPAVIMEYPPKTPFFGNVHDEVREIAPGLYLGPVFERCPCPQFRGWVALQQECGCK